VFSVTGIAVVVTLGYLEIPQLHYSITSTPFVLIGLPLGIFLGFRNNTAYDRFWEGRKAWGALVNTTRSLTRQIITLVEPQPDAPETSAEDVRAIEHRLVHLTIAYVHALRHHLRDSDPFEDLAKLLPESEVNPLRGDENVPLAILQRMGELTVEVRRKHWIHPFHVPVIDRVVAGYCALLPFGLADSIRWATPAVVLCVSYALFGLDAIGDEIEQPFGLDTNDLPLHSISRNIERNLRKRIGEPLPARIEAERGILR
jgi:putative membrane protein